MRKFLTIILALALVMSLCAVPAFAANETSGQTDLTFTYTAPEPTYTVTIPASLDLAFGDNYLDITVSDTANLGGSAIAVTFEGTQDFDYVAPLGRPAYYTHLWLDGEDNGNYVQYDLYDAFMNQIDNPSRSGISLAEFGEPGTQAIKIVVPEDQPDAMTQDASYSGYITFGIQVI